MKNLDWEKVEEIFEKAVEMPPTERDAYLAEVCNNDEDLRRQIEKLILADEKAENFIDSPVFADENIEDSVPPSFLGKKVGQYRLIKELGRGGMGAVFLAERNDNEFKKRVAIKLIKRGMDTDFILKRFRNERQILARLEHPNIARLLDGGTTDDGLPFFVMENVEGQSITKFCDEKELSINERLQLFLQVCAAVEYAHQKSVIHRDLKPGNILVNRDGMPKLLDFGIAKLLNPELATNSIDPTNSILRLMTPEYASPEQIRGETLTPATDIYSLGVLLYEIVTGQRPYQISSRAPHDITSVICETDPLPPDTGAADLNKIILKCLRKKTSERYDSVKDLAQDIQNYLNNLPVSATSFEAITNETDDSVETAISLVVLPFKVLNLKTSEINEKEFLGIGLADALITRLSYLKTVSVRPTSAILPYTAETEMRQIAEELKVSHVLDGRILSVGNRFRLNAQLVRVVDNETIWAGQFEEESDDILLIQDKISAQVAGALVPQLTGAEREKIGKRGTNSTKANEAYLRGRFYWHTYTEEGLAKAITCFYEAIAHDERFAQAYSGVADYYIWLGIYGVLPPTECFASAKEAAQKAIELDSSLAEAYASLAFAVWAFDWDFEESEKLFHRSLELNLRYPAAREWYSHLLGAQGRHGEAVRQMSRAQDLNPQSSTTAAVFAYCLYNARRFEEALAQVERSLSLQPNFHLALQSYGWIYPQLGRTAEAVAPCRKAVELSGRAPLYLWTLGYVLALLGEKDETQKIIAELKEINEKRYVPPVYLAMIYTALNDFDEAFAWLDKAFEKRDYWTLWLSVEPRFDALRKDARFESYLKKIKPLADFEIHQSQIATKILAVEKTGEIEPQTNSNFRFNWFKLNPKIAIAAAFLLILISSIGIYFYQTKSANKSANIDSIAVLPFINATGDSNLEYLSDGISESLINSLSNLKGVKVIAQSSVFRYKGNEVDPQKIGKEMNVRAVLTGKISQRGDTVIISAELVDTFDNRHLWGEKYTQKIRDVVLIQEEIAKQMSRQLQTTLTESQEKFITNRYTENADAYQAYLKGRFYWNKRTLDSTKIAIDYFQQAIKADPNFALAYVGLADCYIVAFGYQFMTADEALSKAENAVQKALELNNNLGEAHASHAYIESFGFAHYEEAGREFAKAVELNPNYATAHQWYSLYLAAMGRREEALREVKIAISLDPVSLIINSDAILVYYYVREYDLAMEQCQKVLEMEPSFWITHIYKGLIYERKKMYQEAISEWEESLKFNPNNRSLIAALGHVYAESGRKQDALKMIEELKKSTNSNGDVFDESLILVGLGQKDKAISLLEDAINRKAKLFIFVKADPRFDSLRSDSKFNELMTQAGFPN
ncbi:MAG: protein kinase [Pyrinomonadaceae bacterium]|nr:protein kinase [Pyrinomonadaceae bacterium]